MSKRVIIVHGWGGGPNGYDWIPWAKRELENKGYEVIVPEMPDTEHPKINSWVSKLAEIAGEVNKEDIFIGHSIGCQTILRFLENLPEGKKVCKVILVAPWFFITNLEEEEEEIAKSWLETPLDFEKVKNKAKEFIVIFSDNDPFVPLEENRKVAEENLGAKVLMENNKGHFTESDGVTTLPEILKLI